MLGVPLLALSGRARRALFAAACVLAACGTSGSATTGAPPPSAGNPGSGSADGGAALTVDPPQIGLVPRGRQSFTASEPGVTWSVKEGDAGGTISASGDYTAPAAEGLYTVVALSPGTGDRAEARVTVAQQTLGNAATHPRLWFNDAQRRARAKAYFTAHPYTPPPPGTTWDGYQAALDTALMHVATGASCTPAITWATALAATPPDVPKTTSAGSDWIRNAGEAVCVVFDWCYDQLTAQQRSTLVASFNTYFGNVQQQAWGGLYNGEWMVENNYFWANLRNEFEWGAVTDGDNTQAAGFLQYALGTRWAAAVTAEAAGSRGGITQEGHSYGPTTNAYPLIPIATSIAGGRDLLAENSYFVESLYWLLYATLPAQTYNRSLATNDWEFFTFGDDEKQYSTGNRPRIFYYGDFMTVAANYYAGTNAGGYAKQWLNQIGPSQTRLTLPESTSAIAPLSLSKLPLDYYGPGVGYLYGRKQWDTSSAVFQWQLGKASGVGGMGHNHSDFGNFQIWRGGRWLTREACGYYNNIANFGNTGTNDISRPEAHNTLFLNGMGINWHTAQPGGPVIKRVESNPSYAFAAVDLTATYHAVADYPTYDNKALVHIEREILFVRPLETTIVLDRLASQDVSGGPTAAQVVKTFLIHFESSPALDDAASVTATNGNQALHVTTLVPAATDARRVVNEAACTGCSPLGLYRLEEDTSGAPQSYFLHVLQARDASAANLTATVADSNPGNSTAGTFTVTLHPATGSDVVVVFQKGMSSSGGSITIGGSTTSLRSDVQAMSVTASGPVWQ
jgi:hypothetical protein